MPEARIINSPSQSIQLQTTAQPEYTFAAYERCEGDCGFIVCDVIVAPWRNGKSPRYYYLKRWATRRFDSVFRDEVIADFNEANDLKSGWYRMEFSKFTNRVSQMTELVSEILYQGDV